MLRECRNLAGIDILDACEGLGVAERTLRGYEASDEAPADIIDSMADLYQNPLLRYWYMAKHPVGKKILPNVTYKDFTTAVLRLKNSVRGIETECIQLAEIADDEVISEEEIDPTLRILGRLETVMHRIIEAVLSIKSNIEKQPPAAKQEAVS